MAKERVLTREEEYDLFRRYREEGDLEARDEIVRCNLNLVISRVREYKRDGVEFDDMVSEGNLGLLRAIEKFDYTKGYKFSTYAIWWINQNISRYIKNNSRTIRVPVHAQEKLGKILRCQADFIDEYGMEPTYEELGERLGMKAKEVEFYLTASERTSSLQEKIGDDDAEMMDFIASDEHTPQEVLEEEERDFLLHKAMETCLTEREKFIIERRFGINCDRKYTLDEVGNMVHVTRERVRQLELQALKKLRLGLGGYVAA